MTDVEGIGGGGGAEVGCSGGDRVAVVGGAGGAGHSGRK